MNEAVVKQGEHAAKQIQMHSTVVSSAAQTIVITNDVEYEQAAKLLLDIKERIKAVDSKRLEFTRPLHQLQKSLNEFFKGPLDDYKKAEGLLKKAMAKFHTDREAARAKALQEAQAAAQKQEKDTFVAKMEKAADNQAPEAEGTHTRRRLMFEVVDEKLVPRHYCSPDEKKIRAVLDNLDDKTSMTIPGVRIWEETTVVAHGVRKK